jgi:hypothetical protein
MRIPTAKTAKAPAKLANDKRASDDDLLCLVLAMEAPFASSQGLVSDSNSANHLNVNPVSHSVNVLFIIN